MAKNLLKAGYDVVVYDVTPAAVDKLKALGAHAAPTPAQVASRADTIVTMLPQSKHVKQAYMTPPDSIFQSLKKGTLLIDSSTILPADAKDIAKEVKNVGGRFIDAPVSGGVGGAEAGTLTFMVGGEQADVERATPLFNAMGKRVFHCGGVGSGQLAKVCNNLVLAISMAGLSEAMNMGVALGMDPAKLAQVINASSGRCWSSDTYNPCPGVMPNVPASKGYEGGFAVELMLKDVGLALLTAKEGDIPLELGVKANSLYQAVAKEGFAKKDFSFVFQYLRDLTKQATKR